MKIIGKGSKESISYLREVVEENSFALSEELSEDGTEVEFHTNLDWIDQRVFESATFVNTDITIIGNGWELKKPKGRQFEYQVE